MAKPMLVTWPCVLLLLDYWPLRRLGGGGHVVAAPVSLRFVLVEKLPLFALSAVACAVALHVQHQGGAIASLEGLPLSQRVANAVVSYVRYLSLTLWPANLAVFYPHPRDTLAAGLVAGAAGLLLGVTLAACLARRRCPYLLVGWLLYLGTLVPVIGLVQAGEQALADRYTYVPLIGLFVAAAWSLADLAAYRPRLRPAVVALAMAVLAVCVVRTVPQVAVWRDGRTLWEHALHVTDDNYVAHLNIGVWFRQHSDFARAEEHLRAALALRPHYGLAHYGLGVTLDLEGKTAEAVASYWQALPLLPEEPHLRNYLAVALAKQQDVEGAVAQFTEAVRLDPTFTEAYHNLAFALARLKRFEEARHYCAECVRLDPDRPQYRLMLAYLLRQCGAEADAREQERGASRLDGQSYR
jgi:Flp pilus assembly protein TadD